MIHEVRDVAAVEEALAAPRAVIYKHSPRCGVCIASDHEIRHFDEGPCGIPVYWVDVVTHADLSRIVADRVGVQHESPQVILLERGRVVWSASHWEVRASDLEDQATRLSTR
jgi:bacillithiol system protein YtxJ